MALQNNIVNRTLALASRLLYGQKITDDDPCYEAVDRNLLKFLRLECTGFEFCPEVTAKLGRMGVPIVEVPVRYRARDIASGKKVRWNDGVVAIAVLLRHRWW